MQISKKSFSKKKSKNPDATHWEGKHYCDCRVRNYRKWLGKKRGYQVQKEIPVTNSLLIY